MRKAKAKAGKKSSRKPGAGGKGSRKPVDLTILRRQIADAVGNQAMGLVQTTIAEAHKGHYAAMKYLFEMIGLYPAKAQEIPESEDSLARTLLQRIVQRESSSNGGEVTKDCRPQSPETVGDTVE
jgi:hypothetical protein